MKGTISLVVAAAVVLLGGGCTNRRYLGSWRMDKEAYAEMVLRDAPEPVTKRVAAKLGDDEQVVIVGDLFAVTMHGMLTEWVANTEMTVDLQIEPDGTCRIVSSAGAWSEVHTCTWTTSGGVIRLRSEGEPPAIGRIRDGSLYLELPKAGGDPAPALKFDRKPG